MNRRKLLKGLLATPALSLMSGCRDRLDPHASKTTTLRIFLMGPFFVVMVKDQGYRVKVFVPYDRERKHELRLQNPMQPVPRPTTSCRVGYQFTLPDHGLLATSDRPYIDHGFDDALLSVDQWTPRPEEYFVALDLPTPHAIGYVPPLYPVQFSPGGNRQSDYARVPLNHVLEYKMVDADDVRMQKKQLEWCGKEVRSEKREELKPLTCDELYRDYQAYWNEDPDDETPPLDQRPYMKNEYASCSFRTFFLGVGLPPESKSNDYLAYLEEHGVEFYNEKLLPSFYQNQPIPRGKKLVRVGKDAVAPCRTDGSAALTPGLQPAVWQYSMPGPHLQYVTGTDNCMAPGGTGCLCK